MDSIKILDFVSQVLKVSKYSKIGINKGLQSSLSGDEEEW